MATSGCPPVCTQAYLAHEKAVDCFGTEVETFSARKARCVLRVYISLDKQITILWKTHLGNRMARFLLFHGSTPYRCISRCALPSRRTPRSIEDYAELCTGFFCRQSCAWDQDRECHPLISIHLARSTRDYRTWECTHKGHGRILAKHRIAAGALGATPTSTVLRSCLMSCCRSLLLSTQTAIVTYGTLLERVLDMSFAKLSS